MHWLSVIGLLATLSLLPVAVEGQLMCPATVTGMALGCPAGVTCMGSCIGTSAVAGANCPATPGANCPANTECFNEVCVPYSTDRSSCPAGCTPAAPYCVSGQCVAHTTPTGANCRTCSTATMTPGMICYKGCLPLAAGYNMAGGPCNNIACPTNTDRCLKICTVPQPTCPTTAPKTGACAPLAPAGPPCPAAPSACPAGQMCVVNFCAKKSPMLCGTPSRCNPAMEECIYGICVPKSTACTPGTCTGTDDQCVTGCVPVDQTLCTGPTACTTATDVCVVGCAAPTPPTSTAPPRLRCQDPATNKTTDVATACEDTGNMTECMQLFPDPATPPTVPATGPVTTPVAVRAPQCDNELLREAAKRCAKTCKICCELPAYSCKDETIPAGAPTCAQNKASGFCTQEGLKPLMQKLCPATCGLCNTTGTAACSDKQDGCFSLAALCLNTQSNAFMKQNCAKTCDTMYPNQGFCPAAGTPGAPGTAPTANTGQNCDVNSQLCNNPLYRDLMTQYCCATCNRCGQTVGGTAGSNNPNCQDQSSACVNWNARGFCRSTFYPDTMKRQQCSRTCGYCT